MSDEAATSGPTQRERRKATGRTSTRNGGPARRDQEVLDAATKVFHSRGYADASVQDIADELGILKGSLYHYINSKEDLLFRLLKESHDEVQAILDEIMAIENLAPLDRLRRYIIGQVEYTSRNLAKMAIYYHDIDKLSDDRRRDLLSKRRIHEQFVTSLIGTAQTTGDVDHAIDANLITNYLFGTMIWVYRWYKPEHEIKPAQLATTCADFIMHGITGKR